MTEDSHPQSIIHDPGVGYDFVAAAYETWHWFRFWQQNEMPIVQEWTSNLAPGIILDAGSGTGLYRAVLERYGHRVIAADLNAKMLAIQSKKHSDALLVQSRVEALPFRNRSFDYILCTRVLTHARYLRPVFSEFARVAKQKAQVLISDVHPEHRYSEMSIPIGAERVSIETYKHSITDMKASLVDCGFEVIRLAEFGLADLAWRPPIENFGNIYAEPDRRIFYMCWLRRL